MTRFEQPLLKAVVIFDHTVMDHCDSASAIKMGVRILVRRRAMCGPAGVPQTSSAVQRFFLQQSAQSLINLALLFTKIESPAVQNGDPGTIIPAILEAAKAFENDRTGLSLTEISYNSAHGPTC